jgi:hypothetical protein
MSENFKTKSENKVQKQAAADRPQLCTNRIEGAISTVSQAEIDYLYNHFWSLLD